MDTDVCLPLTPKIPCISSWCLLQSNNLSHLALTAALVSMVRDLCFDDSLAAQADCRQMILILESTSHHLPDVSLPCVVFLMECNMFWIDFNNHKFNTYLCLLK